jgi:hypothetical protein
MSVAAGVDARSRLREAAVGAGAAGVSLAAGSTIGRGSPVVRLELAATLAGGLLLAAVRKPHAAVVALLALLPLLGLGRRLLIGTVGWTGHDPLLLVSPIFAIAVVIGLFGVRGLPLAPDRLSRLVLGLLAITVLQAANPTSGGLVAGAAGLLFAGVPLLWFFVGRELGDRVTVERILLAIVALALPIALYGYYQTSAGLPSWDAAWAKVSGYAALSLGSSIRAFGTFASAAEYAFYLGIALVICLAAALHGRRIAVLPIPVLAVALFLESSRSILVVGFATCLLLLGMRIGNAVVMVAVLICGFVAVGFALQHYRGTIEAHAQQSQSALVTHQVGGLLHPLDPQQSTLLLKWHGLVGGVRSGVTHPIGSGIAATTLGGEKFGAQSATTENDFSNSFVGLGLAGGVTFLVLFGLALKWAVANYRADQSFAAYATVGVLVVIAGQWLNGGLYAVSPVVWFLIGWVASRRTALEQEGRHAAARA